MNDMQQNEKRKKVFDVVVFIVWLILSILCLLVFLDKELIGLAIAVFSHYFLVIGLLLIKYSKPIRVRGRIKFSTGLAIGLFVTYLGGGSVLLGVIYQICSIKARAAVLWMFPVFFCSVFSAWGICQIAVSVYRLIYRKKYITQPVTATVLKIERVPYTGGDGDTSGVAPTWGYDFGGIHYEQKQDFYSFRCRCKQGEIMEIKVNPEQPTEIDGGNETPFMQIFVGSVFVAMGTLAIMFLYSIRF